MTLLRLIDRLLNDRTRRRAEDHFGLRMSQQWLNDRRRNRA